MGFVLKYEHIEHQHNNFDLYAVVCTRNRPTELKDVVFDLLGQETPLSKVLIVDSSDLDNHESIDLIAELDARISVIRTQPGLCLQRNRALLELPDYGIVSFFDDDVRLQSNYISEINQVFQSDPKVCGVGGRTDEIPAGTRTIRFRERVFRADSYKSGKLLRSGINIPFYDNTKIYEVDWLPGCCMSFRLDLIKNLKFDETRPGVGWGEDVDFSLKASKYGKLVISPFPSVRHLQSKLNRDSTEIRNLREIESRLKLALSFPSQVSISAVTLHRLYSVINQELEGMATQLRSIRNLILSLGKAVLRFPKLLAYSLIRCFIASLFSIRFILRGKKLCSGRTPDFFTAFELFDLSRLRKSPRSTAVKLTGGTGNQLFGFFTAYSVSQLTSSPLIIDLSNYTRSNPRKFSLQPLLGNHITLGKSKKHIPLKEQGFNFDPRVMSAPAGHVLEGYFQSPKYFQSFRREIIDLFQRSIPLSAAQLNSKRIVLHARRGDYTTGKAFEFHGVCSYDYYVAGVKHLRSILGNLPVEIFSDDDATANQLVDLIDNSHRSLLNDSSTDLQVIRYMSTGSGFVLSNSTFGWWASWMNPSIETPTVCPTPWFSNEEINDKDLIPDHWIKLQR
jgi:GT2 family glycosyltransferase